VEEILGANAQAAGPVLREAAVREPLLQAAVRYAEERHWEVAPGAWLIEDDGPLRCCCAEPACAAPGAHPLTRDWSRKASSGPGVVRKWWTENPRAAVLLATGRSFDVIDVPEVAGCLALARMERMGVRLGPVIAAPRPGAGRRLLFFVLPGALPKLPDMLRALGWGPGRLDLEGRGEGDWIVAPPTRVGALGFAQWAREPTVANRWLPEAAELISPLAYACGREAPISTRAAG
jgi:hypothetical protein